MSLRKRLAGLGLCAVMLMAASPLRAVTPQVASTGLSALALKADGSVIVWGWVSGIASSNYSAVPIPMPGWTGVVAIAASLSGKLALKSDGTVQSWDFDRSVTVPGLGGVQAIAAGQGFYLALKADGTVMAWGTNSNGQLGNGTTTSSATPVQVQGLAGVVAIAAGHDHSLALKSDGTLVAWGANSQGQLGNGTTTRSSVPVAVQGLSGVTSFCGGSSHSIAVVSGGSVWGWGSTIGPLVTSRSHVPIAINGPAGIARVACDDYATFAIASDGTVMSWGSNRYAMLGDGTTADNYVPKPVPGLTGAVAMAAKGQQLAVALRSDGTIVTWGTNEGGSLGDHHDAEAKVPPATVAHFTGIVGAAGSWTHGAALRADGTVWTWGDNFRDQHRMQQVANLDFATTPGPVAGLSDVVAVAANGTQGEDFEILPDNAFTLALKRDGTVVGWGSNKYYELGNNQFGTAPTGIVPVMGVTGATAIAAGFFHGLALKSDGTVLAWGDNTAGALGNGTTTASQTAIPVPGLVGVTAIAAGQGYSLALKNDGTVMAWGFNGNASLGNGNQTNSLVPVPVTGLTGIRAIAAGRYHNLALRNDGTVLAWGYDGSLSYTATVSSLTPVVVAGLSGVVAIAAGNHYSFAVKADGTLLGWGDNGLGQLGAITATRVATPTVIPNVSSVRFALGAERHVLAVKTDGTLVSWGLDTNDSLARGSRVADAAFDWVFDGAGGVLDLNGADKTPAAFSLSSQANVPPASNVVSNTVAITGLGGPTPIRMMPGGGEYSVNGGSFTSAPGTIANGNTLTLRVTTPNILGIPWGTGVRVGGTVAKFLVATYVTPPPPIFSTNPATIDFGGQSMNTTTPAMTVTLTNASGGTVTVSSVSAAGGFAVVSQNCATVTPGGTCSAQLTFTPATAGAIVGSLVVATSAGTQSISLIGTGERSLVTHYYRSILRRAPDAGGKAYWEGEAARMASLGANVNETWYALATTFYFSAEYAAFGRDDNGFVTDLYSTFFNRAADAGGLAYWAGLLAQGMPREVVLVSFMFSNEFARFTQGIFGNVAARAEVDTVGDFYRGLLSRLPDSAGFDAWVRAFRTAQCSGAAAVYAQVESISSGFATSAEYLGRNRSAAQYVGDMYNAFLRRGGDLGGVQFWIGQIATGARTREQVRQSFVASPEFSARVAAIIAQGCVP